MACQHSQKTRDVSPMLAHRPRRWPSIKQALVQRLVFADSSWSGNAYCWRRLLAEIDPMSGKCWASVAGAGQYPFSLSATADSEMEVSAYFKNVHITVFWKGCDK